LHLRTGDETYVLTTLGGLPGHLTTNLRAPLILNLSRRLACQVVTEDENSLQHRVEVEFTLRRAA